MGFGSNHELMRAYRVDCLRRNHVATSVQKRETTLTLFGKWIRPGSYLDATANDIEDWLDTRDLQARSRCWHLANLSSFYDWAIRSDLTEVNPVSKILRPRTTPLAARPIRTEDLRRALGLAGPRMRVWLMFACYAGFRCKEIAGQKREDIDEESRLIYVTDPKGCRTRQIPLHPALWSGLQAWELPRRGYLFPGVQGGHINALHISHSISSYLGSVDVRATAHALRHWFGTNIYAGERDLVLTQELMGHASPTTTRKYIRFTSLRAHPAVEGLTV